MPVYPDKRAGKYTGRWRVEVQVGGKRLRARVDTKEQAEAKEEELKKQLESGGAGRPVHIRHIKPKTLGEAIEKAKGTLWRGKASERGNFLLLNVVRRILGENTSLSDIDQETVDELKEGLLDRGIELSTLNRYYSAVGVFLRWCGDRGYMDGQLPRFDWAEESEGRVLWIDEDEEKHIYSIAPEDIAKTINVAITTGLRRSELLSLRLMHQVEILPTGKGWIHLGRTKNHRARSVSVPARTMPHLLWLMNGNMPSRDRLRYQWGLIREALGKGPEFVFHLCRHTCATRMVRAGVHILTIKNHLGHKRIETTMRYAKVADDMLADAVDKVPQVDISTAL